MSMKEVLSQNLKRYRKAAGFNKKQAAGLLGIPYTTYINYENNSGVVPGLDKLCDIAKLYNVTIGKLLGEADLLYPDILIRAEDIKAYLSLEDELLLKTVVEKIAEGRTNDGKDPHPRITIL